MERTPGIDRRSAIRRAAAVGVTISALPGAAAAASGEYAEPASETGDSIPAPSESVAGLNETLTAPAPTAEPPVLTATASMSELSIGTDKDSFPAYTYQYRVNDGSWVPLNAVGFTVDISASASPLTVSVQKTDGTTTAASLVTITKLVRTVTPGSATVSLVIANSPSGTRGVSVIAVGGNGGRGGHDQARTGGNPSNPGLVEATYDLPQNITLVARAGSGGRNGDGGDGVSTQAPVGADGGAGGTNGLSRSGATGTYDGAKGGQTGTATRAGGGGGGGAASVLQIGADNGTPIVVAAGSGGGGGANREFTGAVTGQNGQAGTATARTDDVTDGRRPLYDPRDGDYGGHGAGGGGFRGGQAEQGSVSERGGRGGGRGSSYSESSVSGVVRTAGGTLSTASGRAAELDGYLELSYWTVAIT